MMNILKHHDETKFNEPNQFILERWPHEKLSVACPATKASNLFSYLPFGFGKRS